MPLENNLAHKGLIYWYIGGSSLDLCVWHLVVFWQWFNYVLDVAQLNPPPEHM